MKTKSLSQDKISIVTLGCAKNLVDSEALFTQLKGNKMDVSHQEDDSSNIVIINTCGFIDAAKQESIDTILRYADAKTDGQIKKLYVTGCLSERYRDELRTEIPQVDAFFGTREMFRLLKTLKADYKKELVGERLSSTPSHYAYLKISEGCDRPCSFCAIPLMRGKHISKPMEEVISEATSLVKHGTKEILIIAQDSTYYGLDIYKRRNLAELLQRLSDVEGLEWIRLHYAFPTGFPMDALKVMAERENICNYLDIPLQHGSDAILKAMRRGTTREKTTQLISDIRNAVPDIAIRTTMIAGHPGETEKDWQEMVDFVQESRFERLGVFTYSHEENTHSYSLKDNVPEKTKQKRANQLMEVQQQISLEKNEEKVGKVLKVLIDKEENDYFVGRTEYDSPEVDNEVLISSPDKELSVGDFVNCTITEATEFDLYATPIK
ncbi:MAG: 30S ribosomal protein S12 methylthiotransferase RimO [Cyclobacteriaceae bacterium]|nr:30S ribosomal protein S12 methylthiotransferase RimO [Cyclobacteriaceae bacterium]